MKQTCIDVAERYGHRYRVVNELPPDLRTEARRGCRRRSTELWL
jgi:hypothetical protein